MPKAGEYIYKDKVARGVIKEYKNGVSGVKLALKYRLGQNTIYRILARKNEKVRNLCDSKRKYYPKEDFFNKIDSFEKAYVFGLLLSDGCNYESKGLVKIALQEGDKEILEKMSKLLYKNYRPLTQDNSKQKFGWQRQFILSIKNWKISKRLSNLGMMADKTHKLAFPNCLKSNELFAGFLLGFFDGDGWLYVNKKNGAEFAIVSTKKFIYGLQSEIKKRLRIKSFIYRKNGQFIHSLRIRKFSDIIHLYKFLYKTYKNKSFLFLKRKRDKFETLLKIKGIDYASI